MKALRKPLFFTIALVAALFIVVGFATAATTSPLMPFMEGSYLQWTPKTGTTHYTMVDEASCNGTTDYNFTTTVGQRDSYRISTSSIPNGATITAIAIQPCASRNNSGGGSSTMDVFYRFNGADSADAGAYALPTGTTPQERATTTFSGLSLTATTTSIIEVGAVYTAGTKGIRLSRMMTVITYTALPPSAPSNASATASSTGLRIGVSWVDNSSDETNFEVVRGTDGVSFGHLATTSANVQFYTDNAVSSSTTYYYKVRAYNSGGYSSDSNIASTTTP